MKWITLITIVLLAGMIVTGMKVWQAKKSSSEVVFPNTKVKAVWIWEDVGTLSQVEIVHMVNSVRVEGFNTIYLDLSNYTDAEIPFQYVDFLTEAKRNNLLVQAVIGSPKWSVKDNHYIPLAVVEKVLMFNSTHQDVGFDGIQYDIEFYSDPEYKADQIELATQYLELVESTISIINDRGSSVKFGVALPPWLKKGNSLSPLFTYGGTKDYVIAHVANILKGDNAYIVFMAYRDSGKEIVETIKPTLDILKPYSIEVVEAVEVTSTEEVGISFAGMTKEFVTGEINFVMEQLKPYPQLSGFAVNNFQSYLRLK